MEWGKTIAKPTFYRSGLYLEFNSSLEPLIQAMDWGRDGRICETKTVIGLFWLEKMLEQG